MDLKNTFNSARWADILKVLERTFEIPSYLLNIVGGYMRDIHLQYDTADGLKTKEITGGAAPGSMFGPDL